MTKLVNVKNKNCDVYIGRRMPNAKFKARTGFDGYFGNPFRLEDYSGDRDACIKDYKDYFYNRLGWDEEFYNKVRALKDKVLGCWCWPELCHGEVIIEYLDYDCKDCDIAGFDHQKLVKLENEKQN